jgi:hypothetical protein
MGNVSVRFLEEKDIDVATTLMVAAWEYYLQETSSVRVASLLKDQIENPSSRILLAFTGSEPAGIAEFSIVESYRYDGEEARLEMLFIKESAANYYDIHSALMDAIFEFLRNEHIEFLRIDTTLENADVMVV